ncbi:hypothetical protein PR202_gb15864 [Eleusine coracana subsp. coracana]|uniref:Uncharacterized protein n=1 Tax=Eleusine coracana subsp. coracana TaxID=191504 RepID=A0AAV5EY99_ELECO|nr:hypothetical protein PR202_gb15864 [Eleusine coracana subsp. coracana]
MASTVVSWQPDLELKELRHKLRKFLAAAEKKEAAKHAGVLVQDVMVVPAAPTPSTLLFSYTPTPPLPTMKQKSLNDLTLQELVQLHKERLEVRGDKQHPSAEEASKIEVEEVLTPELQIVEGVHVLQIDDGGCLIKSDGHQIEEDNPEVDNKDGHQVAVGDHRIKEEDDHQIGVGDHLINEEGSLLLGPGMQFSYFSARDLFSARSTLPSYNAKVVDCWMDARTSIKTKDVGAASLLCDEKYVHGNNQACKRLFLLELTKEPEEGEYNKALQTYGGQPPG